MYEVSLKPVKHAAFQGAVAMFSQRGHRLTGVRCAVEIADEISVRFVNARPTLNLCCVQRIKTLRSAKLENSRT